MATILMCPPTYYGIEYEINPWMKRTQPADHTLAEQQWHDLTQQLQSQGVKLVLLEPQIGMPDLVFTANAGLLFQNRVIVSHFRYAERQGEEAVDRRWFQEQGFEVLESPDHIPFEGAGDALFCGDTLFAGYRIRSHASGLQKIGQLLQCRVIPLELVDPYYYHLDTCFCPLAPGVAAWFPAAFDPYAQRVVREWIPCLIEVAEEEARSFACNAVVVGNRVITNVGCPQFHAQLERHHFEPIGTPLSEFVKSGGSAKCLTLRLDGEEAAGWKTTTPIATKQMHRA
jgi:N-dimethylarginine dimethylaminohydrolase